MTRNFDKQEEGIFTEMAKKVLLCAMAIVFCIFLTVQLVCTGEIGVGVDLSIATAVVLIGLFIVFIIISERERKSRTPRP